MFFYIICKLILYYLNGSLPPLVFRYPTFLYMCLGLDGGAYHFGADPVGVLSALATLFLRSLVIVEM